MLKVKLDSGSTKLALSHCLSCAVFVDAASLPSEYSWTYDQHRETKVAGSSSEFSSMLLQ